MVKKGFMKTVEILLVVVLTAIFLTSFMPARTQSDVPEPQPILIHLEDDAGFRMFVQQNEGCFNKTQMDPYMDAYLTSNIEYIFCSDASSPDFPDKPVVVDTLFFAGNMTSRTFKTLKLYYWVR